MKFKCPDHQTPFSLFTTKSENEVRLDCGCKFRREGTNLWPMLSGISEGTKSVQDFYEESPFPNYNDFESFSDFFSKGIRNDFTLRIARSITENSNVVEIGCGTGQLVNFLSSITPANYIGFDLTNASLKLADQFAYENDLPVTFVQGDIFKNPFVASSFDTVVSLGVLHHTIDCRLAIKNACELVSDHGQIIVGLYNTYGRLWTDFRRIFLRSNSTALNKADQHLRKNLSPSKRLAWIRDQYFHPLEKKFSIEWTIRALSEYGFKTFATVPAGLEPEDSKIFREIYNLDFDDIRLGELNMLFDTHGAEGGLHIVWAKR